ncbi:hypothetical protein Dimus_036655, partial [Dionaea muscipula]
FVCRTTWGYWTAKSSGCEPALHGKIGLAYSQGTPGTMSQTKQLTQKYCHQRQFMENPPHEKGFQMLERYPKSKGWPQIGIAFSGGEWVGDKDLE